MTINEFRESLDSDEPPSDVSPLLKSLWWDKKGQWDKAHEMAQSVDDRNGALVHAYLHRKEGDKSNAGYWYARAGRVHSTLSLEEEWEEIVNEFLN